MPDEPKRVEVPTEHSEARRRREAESVDAKFTIQPRGGNAAEEQEAMEEQMAKADQYAMTGAMNYPMALLMAMHNYKHLSKEARDDIIFVVVTRGGAMQWFGGGGEDGVFPNNDELPVEAGFMVLVEDIEEELAAEKEEEKNAPASRK